MGLSDGEGLDLIERALSEGARIIDTSDIYAGGNSERVVGTWRQGHLTSDAFIQTKTGMTRDGPNLAPDRVRQQLQHSIAVLGHVDLYLAHAVDSGTPWSESLPVFSAAVESGQIRAYGLSNVDGAALWESRCHNSRSYPLLLAWGGRSSPSELAQLLLLDRSTMSRNLTLMETRGWVAASETSPTGRSLAVQITPAGTAQLASAERAWRNAQESVLASLGEDAAPTLDAWLAALSSD
jgi:aryl-alcohol dehydrogenase-like predicted oxidoreductase